MPSIGHVRLPARRVPLVLVVIAVLAIGGSSLTTASAGTPLSPVRNLVASVTGDVATISWQAPVSGTVARYQIEAHHTDYYNESFPDFGTRIAGPAATSITWDDLPLNQSTYFTVTPIGPDNADLSSGAAGPFNTTGTVTPSNSYCSLTLVGDCLVVNTSEALGAEQHPGSGLLHGTVPAGNPWVGALKLKHWRIQAANPTQFTQASAVVGGSNVIESLSDAWLANNHVGSAAVDPWSNWTTYRRYIAGVVKTAEAANQNPIWEIQNEPENYPYSAASPATRTLVEQEYLKAYQAIKGVDPNARVIGPSIDWQYEGAASPWYIDMKTFIPFAAANGMKLYAIAWHDNYDTPDQNPLVYGEQPEALRDQAEAVRELIAENPGIGSPLLYADEDSSSAGTFIPGFAAGYVAADDRAGVSEANRSCWAYPPGGSVGTVCTAPNLGELLNADGNPNDSYWTMADYAAMTGSRVESESTDLAVSSLAVTDSSGTTRVLLGRHQTCSRPTTGAAYCSGPTSLPGAMPTTVQVELPTAAHTATVQVQEIADSTADVVTAPATSTSTVAVTSGVATVFIPAFGDGEAFFLTVTPNVTSGAGPASGDQTVGEVPAATGTAVPTRLVPMTGSSSVVPAGSSIVALATDQYGNPLPGTQVTFFIPSSNYGHFSGGVSTTAVVTTDSFGIATSPPIVAGLRHGTWTGIAYLTQLGLIATQPYCYFVGST
jgi:hypothetical protein